jgi:hypothetical protein
MRAKRVGWTAAVIALAWGCGPRADQVPPSAAARPDVKAPGNLPVRTAEQLAEEDRQRAVCVEACTGDDAARAACAQACLGAHPIEQVELAPRAPQAPSTQPPTTEVTP